MSYSSADPNNWCYSFCVDVLLLIDRCLSGFLTTHIISIVLTMMPILLGFALSQMYSRNTRTQRRVRGTC